MKGSPPSLLLSINSQNEFTGKVNCLYRRVSMPPRGRVKRGTVATRRPVSVHGFRSFLWLLLRFRSTYSPTTGEGPLEFSPSRHPSIFPSHFTGRDSWETHGSSRERYVPLTDYAHTCTRDPTTTGSLVSVLGPERRTEHTERQPGRVTQDQFSNHYKLQEKVGSRE